VPERPNRFSPLTPAHGDCDRANSRSQSAVRWVNGHVESDRELVLALCARKSGAFDQLYRQYHERIWRFLARLAGGGAEDLFQETWLAAARYVHRLREDTLLLPWLFTIARNKHRNNVRTWLRQSRQRQALRGHEVAAPVPIDEKVHAHRQAEQTWLAFSRLSQAHREVLLLCVVEGLAVAEVAQILECTHEAVRKRLSRARQELARLVGRREPEGEAR
jgi:RNA polymerase sigma factor (sigma-70 family)